MPQLLDRASKRKQSTHPSGSKEKKKERKTTPCSVSEAAVAGSLWARCLAPVQKVGLILPGGLGCHLRCPSGSMHALIAAPETTSRMCVSTSVPAWQLR